ncbi:MAG: hypothetical protein JO217_01980 [Acidobacteriaceae bacterium]|nr:hypothetical protein [Acidobacteriaceae bacterium]MBV9441440.1 hypothetical protein [Acidobacteriaceae bacterium]
MFFATPNGLSALSHHGWRVYTSTDGLPPGNVNCLLEDSNSVLWIGTAKGLAFFRSGHFQVPREMPEPYSCISLSSIAPCRSAFRLTRRTRCDAAIPVRHT